MKVQSQGLGFRPGIVVEPDDFDKNKYLINVMNDTIELPGQSSELEISISRNDD